MYTCVTYSCTCTCTCMLCNVIITDVLMYTSFFIEKVPPTGSLHGDRGPEALRQEWATSALCVQCGRHSHGQDHRESPAQEHTLHCSLEGTCTLYKHVLHIIHDMYMYNKNVCNILYIHVYVYTLCTYMYICHWWFHYPGILLHTELMVSLFIRCTMRCEM